MKSTKTNWLSAKTFDDARAQAEGVIRAEASDRRRKAMPDRLGVLLAWIACRVQAPIWRLTDPMGISTAGGARDALRATHAAIQTVLAGPTDDLVSEGKAGVDEYGPWALETRSADGSAAVLETIRSGRRASLSDAFAATSWTAALCWRSSQRVALGIRTGGPFHGKLVRLRERLFAQDNEVATDVAVSRLVWAKDPADWKTRKALTRACSPTAFGPRDAVILLTMSEALGLEVWLTRLLSLEGSTKSSRGRRATPAELPTTRGETVVRRPKIKKKCRECGRVRLHGTYMEARGGNVQRTVGRCLECEKARCARRREKARRR